MKNPFRNKCPVCRSTDLSNPDGWMPFLYTMKPITCNACTAKFEPNIISRVGLWLFLTVLLSFVFTQRYLTEMFGKDAVGILFLSFIALFFISIVFGLVMDVMKPWQFTIWDNRTLRRAIVNYGAVVSMVLYGALFYSLRDSWLKEAPRPNPSINTDCRDKAAPAGYIKR